MKSQSQQRREKIMQATPKGTRPAWKASQQKETKPKDNDDREEEKKATASDEVKVKMKTNYRDVAKKGDDWVTDRQKADELVKLGRAEYVK